MIWSINVGRLYALFFSGLVFLLSATSLDDLYETIPAQYISTLYGKRESGTLHGASAGEVYNMMQLSAGERNRQMSISSEVNNAELMIRYIM